MTHRGWFGDNCSHWWQLKAHCGCSSLFHYSMQTFLTHPLLKMTFVLFYRHVWWTIRCNTTSPLWNPTHISPVKRFTVQLQYVGSVQNSVNIYTKFFHHHYVTSFGDTDIYSLSEVPPSFTQTIFHIVNTLGVEILNITGRCCFTTHLAIALCCIVEFVGHKCIA